MVMKVGQTARIIAAKEGLEQVQKYKLVGDYGQAQQEGIKSLRRLGLSVKVKPNLVGLLLEINRTKGLFNHRRLKSLGVRGKPISEKEQLQLSLLTELCGPTAVNNEDLYLLLLLHIAKITAKREASMYSALGYAGFALIALNYLEEEGTAETLVDKAITSIQGYEAPLVQAAVYYILGHYVGVNFSAPMVWLNRLLQGAEDASKGRDSCYVGLNYEAWASLDFEVGQSLLHLNDRLQDLLHLTQQPVTLRMGRTIELMCKATEILLTGNQKTLLYDGPCFASDIIYRMNYFAVASTLALVELDTQRALTIIHEARKDRADMKASYLSARLYYNEGVAMTMEAMNGQCKKSIASGRLKQLKRLFDYKVHQNPDLYGHMYKTMAGCSYLLIGEVTQGITEFELAIKRSVEKSNFRDAAMASVLLGHHCKFNGLDKSALYYFSLGAEYYGSWGASAISEDLMRRHQISVEPEEISERWQSQVDPLEEEAYLEALHLLEVIYARPEDQSLEVAFAQRLIDYFQMDKVMVFREDNHKMGLVLNGIRVQPWKACEDGNTYSLGVIQHVWKHTTSIRINSDRNHRLMKYDAYLMDHGHGSVLGIPIADEGGCFGVVYMEREADVNDQTLKTIQRLTDQVAIILKRASLG